MNSTKKLFVAAMIATAALSGSAAAYLTACLRVAGDYPKTLLSTFYGYSSQNNGPGDTAFAQCRNFAESNGVPLFLVYGTDSCTSCDSFAQLINPKATTWAVLLGQLKCVKAYFRGNNSGTAPKACADAKNFIDEIKTIDTDPKHVNWSSGCHLMVMYSVKPNGKKFVRSARVSTSAEAFKTLTYGWYAEWEVWWNTVDETPPNVAFALGAGTSLEAAASTETINVPMVRTNDYATAERPDWLVAKYPDGSVVTNEVACGTDKTLEVPVENRWTKPGDKITLTILNMDLDEMGSSSIKFVDTPANSAAFPLLSGGAGGLGWGEWTVDFAAATGKVYEAADAYTLVVHGGIVWDDALSALNGDVFAKSQFTDWCERNQIALVYLDKAEPGTGASLFSYNVASNGNSGASFMSINGLSAEQGEALAEKAEEDAAALFGGRGATALPTIALVRADGTICGYLRPQFNEDGTCDLAENMARLDELLAQSADEVEAANDTPAGADVLTWGEDADGTLSVNDIVDFFMLSGECGDKDIVFDITPEGEVAECAYPDAVVYRYDEASGECSEVESVLSIFSMEGVRSYEMVYSVSQDDVDNGRIFVAATAYVEPEAAEAKLGGASAFNYVISVRDATPNPGLVTFDEQPETAVVQAETNQVFEVPLYRMLGKTGEIDITVSIDETLTTATNRYEFVETNVVWAAGEMGIKYVPVTLKGSALNDGLYDITLRIDADAAMADVEKYFTTYTISYGKEPTEAGQLSVRSVTPAASADGRVYVRYSSEGDGTLRTEDEMSVQVNRTGGKGPAAAYISWKNGKETSVETLSWANYLTGTQTAFLTDGFPAPGKNGYADVTMTVTSSNSVSVPMVKDGSTIKVRVLPYDAPLFGQSEVTWSGIQYTTADTNLTMLAIGYGMNVKSLMKVSGDVPAGLKVSVDADGTFVVTGTSTAGTGTTSATYLVALTREDGGIVYSMPVTVTFENKALADVNDSFTSARFWKGLPMVADDGFAVKRRLMGLLDLSVAKNGKTSAKYRMAGGKTVSFSSSGLAGVEADGAVKLGAKKSVKIGGETKEYVLSATLGADGSLEASVTDGESEVVASAPTGAEPWGGDNTAERFGGIYTVAYPLADEASADANTLCWGAVSMQLKCATASAWKKGSVTFAGTLPNGKSVSGTATFVPVAYGATSATLPILSSSSADTFSAMVDIDGDGVVATEDVTPYWRHNEGGIESLSYENDYDAVGSAWSWAAWLDCFGGTFDAKSAFGMSFNLSKASGVAAGTMRAQIGETGPFSIVQWKGIALTGEKKIMGACWRSATIEYDEGRKRTVKIGDAVEMTQE